MVIIISPCARKYIGYLAKQKKQKQAMGTVEKVDCQFNDNSVIQRFGKDIKTWEEKRQLRRR